MSTGIIAAKPHFHLGNAVPPDFFINREQEIDECKRILARRYGNILLIGKRKVGKTSFVNKIKDEIEKENVLCVKIDLFPFDQNPSDFLREILLILCYEIGAKVFGKKTSEMLSSLNSKQVSIKGDYGRFHRIYRLSRIMSISNRSQISFGGKIGTSLLGGETSYEKESQNVADSIHSFEFIELSGELMEICKNSGFTSIAIIADEANRLAVQTSKEILQAYFDIFASKSIQFVFVADYSLVDYRPIRDVFDFTLVLGPFSKQKYIYDLLSRYYNEIDGDYSMFFEESAIEQIWQLSRGFPYIVQILCNGTIEMIGAGSSHKINSADIMKTWITYVQNDQLLTELWNQ